MCQMSIKYTCRDRLWYVCQKTLDNLELRQTVSSVQLVDPSCLLLNIHMYIHLQNMKCSFYYECTGHEMSVLDM